MYFYVKYRIYIAGLFLLIRGNNLDAPIKLHMQSY